MTPPRHRLIIALVGALVSLLTLEAIERTRATQTPSGWTRSAGEAVATTEPAWRIGNSAWRLGGDTTWSSDTPHEQLYMRPALSEDSQIGMTLSTHNGLPLWVWLAASGQVAAMQEGVVVPCMGRIQPNDDVEAIELSLEPDGLKVKRGNAQMICPADTPSPDPPIIRALNGEIELQSVGRDRRSDGIPLSPLWWMSGLMGLGFTWMLLFDLGLSIVRRIQPFRPEQEE